MQSGQQETAPSGECRHGPLVRAGFVMLDLLLLPCAVWWVRRREAVILRHGERLDLMQVSLACAVGVAAPERVRVMATARVPLPMPFFVCRMAERLGWLSPHIAGMTLGYGIVLRGDCRDDRRLLAHELAHVAQYERYSSGSGRGRYAGFLRRYLRECVQPGYPHGPLETEAHRAESVAARRSRSQGGNVIPYAPVYISDAAARRENQCQ